MLATARSLSRRGVSYAAIGVAPWSPMGVSRYLRPHLAGVGPDARAEPEAFAEFLLDVVRERGVRLVMPLSDRTLLTCDRFRDAIEAEARLAAPPSTGIRNVLDKKVNLETARELGIPCPESFDLKHLEQIPELIEALGLPLVLKQPGPSIDGERPRLDLDWLLVRDRRELERLLEMYAQQGTLPVVQRFVPYATRKLCCFAVSGEIVAIQQWWPIRALRGFSVFREMTPVSPDLHRFGASMLEALHWNGVAHFEFKVNESDGDVRYIETNGRPWGTIEASIALGWDFPWWMYRFFLHGERPKPPPSGQGVGTKARWHLGELKVLLEFLRGRPQPGWPERGRIEAILDYFSGFSRDVHPDVFRVDDPLPELAQHVSAAYAGAYDVLRRIKPLRSLYRSVKALTKNNS